MKEGEYRNLLERRGYLESYDFLAAMPEDHLIRDRGRAPALLSRAGKGRFGDGQRVDGVGYLRR